MQTTKSTRLPQTQHEPPPNAGKLFWLWTLIGLQSFGGGSSTMLLMQKTFSQKHRWISEEEFARFLGLCFFTPGINLVALTILIGRRLRGASGVIISLTGLLLPSGIITCLLTAGFRQEQNLPVVQAILRGVIPATAGIMLLVGLNMIVPLMKTISKEGPLRLIFSLLIVASCALLVIVAGVSVILVLFGAATLSALFFSFVAPRPTIDLKGETND